MPDSIKFNQPIISLCKYPNGFIVPVIAPKALSGNDLEGFKANTRFSISNGTASTLPAIQHINSIIYPKILTATDKTNNNIINPINLEYLLSGLSIFNKNKINKVANKCLDYISSSSKKDLNNKINITFDKLNEIISTSLDKRNITLEFWRSKPIHNWSNYYKLKTDEQHYKILCNMDYKSNLMVHITLTVDPQLYSHDEAVKNITKSFNHLKRTLKDNNINIVSSSSILEFHIDENNTRFEYPHLHSFFEIEKSNNIDIQKRLIRRIVRKSWRLRDTQRTSLDIGEVKFIKDQDHFDNACPYCVFSPNIKGTKYKRQSELPKRYYDKKFITRHYHSVQKDNKPIPDKKPSSISKKSNTKRVSRTYGQRIKFIGTSFRITDTSKYKSNGRKLVKSFTIDIPFEIVKKIHNRGYNEDKAIFTKMDDKALANFLKFILLYRGQNIKEGKLNARFSDYNNI